MTERNWFEPFVLDLVADSLISPNRSLILNSLPLSFFQSFKSCKKSEMRKSVSLKEFSTTPTVSCMLRKDGNNVATDGAAASTENTKPRLGGFNAPSQPAGAQQSDPKKGTPTNTAAESDVMFEME